VGEALSIRIAGADDAARLSLVGSATMLETYAERIRGDDIVAHCSTRHGVAVYLAWLADPSVTIWLAETATGAPVGYLVLMAATLPDVAPHPDDLEVQRIYVLSRYHGTGIGRRLMQKAIDTARDRRARQLVLGVLKVNAKAVAFYRRQGFSEIGVRTFHVGTSVFDDYVFGRTP
jgi:ribosomal protein S18 acetylase RimI-like enzyme